MLESLALLLFKRLIRNVAVYPLNSLVSMRIILKTDCKGTIKFRLDISIRKDTELIARGEPMQIGINCLINRKYIIASSNK